MEEHSGTRNKQINDTFLRANSYQRNQAYNTPDVCCVYSFELTFVLLITGDKILKNTTDFASFEIDGYKQWIFRVCRYLI